jgi:hypothetical protein
MYLIGAEHPNKGMARLLLERCIREGVRLVSDVVVLQEILHRYSAIRRLDAIQPAFDALLRVVDEVYPVHSADVQRAKELLLGSSRISARDALHAAIMERHEVTRLLSFDSAFDSLHWIERIK